MEVPRDLFTRTTATFTSLTYVFLNPMRIRFATCVVSSCYSRLPINNTLALFNNVVQIFRASLLMVLTRSQAKTVPMGTCVTCVK